MLLECIDELTKVHKILLYTFPIMLSLHLMPLVTHYAQTYAVTGPEKTGVIYTNYTCLYYGLYLLFCMRYIKCISFIEFRMDFCICDDVLDTILITDKKLLILHSQN